MAIEDFDDILPHVGSFGPFQKRILLLSLPVNYFLAVVYMAQSTRPCLILLLFLRFLVQEKLQMVLRGGPNSSWSTKPCSTVDGWDYDLSGGMYHTVVSEYPSVDRLRPGGLAALFHQSLPLRFAVYRGQLGDGYPEDLPAGKIQSHQLDGSLPLAKDAQRFLLITLTWMVITVVYDGYVRSLAILPYSVFITNSCGGALELPC
uniref:Uncharacterized protein n=1 Tax=Daphnia galeata TaxID=27404 RepID=A0A8J2S0E2_9CRUS|nr:unnamed protein product [Daphnia galeata]